MKLIIILLFGYFYLKIKDLTKDVSELQFKLDNLDVKIENSEFLENEVQEES